MDNQLRQIIEEAWNDRALLAESRVREAVRAVIEELDKGRLRTAEPIDPSRSQWQVNEWVKKAILLYFPMQEMRTTQMMHMSLSTVTVPYFFKSSRISLRCFTLSIDTDTPTSEVQIISMEVW